jgi:hypothetical protein
MQEYPGEKIDKTVTRLEIISRKSLVRFSQQKVVSASPVKTAKETAAIMFI